MQKITASKYGFVHPRNLLGLFILFSGLGLAVIGIAAPTNDQKIAKKSAAVVRQPNAVDATPANGTLTPATKTITYTDGPLVSNPTHLVFGSPECAAPNTCSDFTLTVSASSLAATHNLVWTMQWPVPNVDCDIFILKDGNLVSANIGYSDPATLALPVPADGTVYHLVTSCSVGTSLLTGTAALLPKYPTSGQGAGIAPRYFNYTGTTSQANSAGEPSIGVDWNPNIASLKTIAGQTRKNTGGVAFFTAIDDQFRSNFDDCSSPAINVWEDVNSPIITGLDPIGFVDHFSTAQLGVSYPPPQTPGRVFHLQLAAGSSTAALSDNDGGSWTSFVAGGPPAGPDHETLGGGPFHAPIPTPPAPAYPNATYYCSQFGVENASCSRSDDGGLTFGPAVPIFPPTLCAGGLHGHIKVSPQGTAYVPNSACAEGTGPNLGVVGVALSKDNGITWTQQSVPGSTGSEDPAVGIGQNNVGKPPGQVANTLYLGWVSADGHPHVAHSPDEGETWEDNIDVGSIFGIEEAVFAAVVAGDDNRAAFAFLGTVPAFYPTTKVWHLYIATTYDGGNSWILIDATPNDPVQIGNICLLGTGCDGARNLLDFNGIDVDSEGRVLVGYADGCINCTNNQTAQSNASKGTIARQSGGRRLFAAFDPIEPAPPAAPQVLSAVRVTAPVPGVEVSWLQPDNGASPITGYNIYRSSTSGAETFYAHVNGADTLKYLDQNAPSTSNWFYKIMAVNQIGESTHCREVSVDSVQPVETACVAPYLTMQIDPTADQTGAPNANSQFDIQRVNMGEPFTSCSDKSITFRMKVQNLNPAPPPNGAWRIYFNANDSNGTSRKLFVQMDTQQTPTPSFNYGYDDGGTSLTQCFLNSTLTTCPATGTVAADGTIDIKLNVSAPLTFFSATNTSSTPDFTVNIPVGTTLTAVQGETVLLVGAVGTGQLVTTDSTGNDKNYTTIGNLGCVATPPIAVLTGSPLSGPPGTTVNFSGAASTDPNPCTTIASYTMNFGDGTSETRTVAQHGAANAPLFSHTYNQPGFYSATLTVTDSAGQVSTNPAQLVIEIKSSQLQLVGVASRKVHGGSGTFDLTLSSGSPRSVECRFPGDTADPGVDYKLVFVFPNDVASVGSISATATGGSQPNQPTGAIGTDPRHYIVNLTGVPNGQYITVNLTNVQDVDGASGNFSATMGVLGGDQTGNGAVSNTDISNVKGQVSANLSNSNFRADITHNGAVSNTDVSETKSRVGNQLPSSP